MLTKEEEDFYCLPSHCNICGREMPASERPPFCEEHRPQYEARQRAGVRTDELDRQWDDTLDNWRDRPAALDGEIGAKASSPPLLFWQYQEPWVLFVRLYPAPTEYQQEPRESDCLAVNVQSQEFRRFVDISPEDALDDLRGRRPAPYQAELAPFWGEPGPIGLRQQLERRYLDEQQHIHIPELVHAIPFPVYGLVDNPLGLAVRSVCWISTNYQLTSVSFTFSSPRYPEECENVTISSLDAKQRGITYNSRDSSGNPFFDMDARLFEHYRLSSEVRKQAGSPLIEGETFNISNVKFTGEIRHWSQPHQISRFFLKSDETFLSGFAFGPSQPELLQLLKEVVVINHRDELLTQYQRELDQETERLFGKIG